MTSVLPPEISSDGWLEFRGERTRVTGLAREAIQFLLRPPPGGRQPEVPPEDSPVFFSGWEVHKVKLALSHSGTVVVVLTPLECTILELLFLRGGRGVSHSGVFEWCYPQDGPVDDQVIRVMVWKLRKKFLAKGVPLELRTLRGFGYGVFSHTVPDLPPPAPAPCLDSTGGSQVGWLPSPIGVDSCSVAPAVGVPPL